MAKHNSFGRLGPARPARVIRVSSSAALPELASVPGPLLPYGRGRSYGDSCLNDRGTLLETSGLRRVLALDEERGILRCEAGLTLQDVLAFTVPRGWYLPVVPGTQLATVGGAIANDVHGKNHHRAGTFGRHVLDLELLRTDGRVRCTPDEQADLFRATIGGLGLTGLILSASIRLRRITTPWIREDHVPVRGLPELLELTMAADETHEYTVAWLDGLLPAHRLGEGFLIRGNHVEGDPASLSARPAPPLPAPVPVPIPPAIMQPLLRGVNRLHYWRHTRSSRPRRVHHRKFFFPLDGIAGWHRLYGASGFFQYQCVIPPTDPDALRAVLERVGTGRLAGPYLFIIKVFGSLASPGLLSFPRPGVSLVMEFPHQGRATLALLDELDAIVRGAGGAVYPAKDARMSAASFQAFYPQWREFRAHIDERFSSNFWRRVTAADRTSPVLAR